SGGGSRRGPVTFQNRTPKPGSLPADHGSANATASVSRSGENARQAPDKVGWVVVMTNGFACPNAQSATSDNSGYAAATIDPPREKTNPSTCDCTARCNTSSAAPVFGSQT